jgi:hypothetical protein
MKKALIIFSAIIMMAAFSTNLMAQPNSVTTTASANVVIPLTLVQVSNLCFGTMTSPGSGSATVVLSPNGNITGNGGGIVLLSQTPTPTVGSYTVTGQPNTYYNIYLPTSPVTITNPSSNTMTIDSWQTSENNYGTVGLLNGNGTDAFTLGATLHVGQYQSLGLYTGTFPVTVNYN